ncbi:MAG TPA: hypothetical protein VGT04_09660, partial [Acidobacteriaceae bacterium]|nr:hypothetical protein [Acidobacteriaceae bacterium]
SWWALTKVVTRLAPFHFTVASRRNSLPLTVSRNWLPPAVALAGEMEVRDGTGGQVPQDSATTVAATSTTKTGDLAVVAIGLHLRQTGGREAQGANSRGRQD